MMDPSTNNEKRKKLGKKKNRSLNLGDAGDGDGNALAGVDVGAVHLQRHRVQRDAAR